MPFKHDVGDSEPKIKSNNRGRVTIESKISYQDVKDNLWVDPKTGFLYRCKSGRRTALPGKSVYPKASLCGSPHYAHRIVWMLTYGAWPNGLVDHINGDPKDNRPVNLRLVSHAQNMRNRKPSGLSKHLGVSWSKQDRKWVARIRCGGPQIHLGFFSKEADAAEAYRLAAKRMHGEHSSYSLVHGDTK